MRQTNTSMTAIRYQNNRNMLASFDEFDAAWREGVRVARRSLDGLERKEARLFDDLQRGRGTGMLRQAFEIIRAKSTSPTDAAGLAEQLRGFVIAGHVIDLSEPEAHRQEDEANSRGNAAQFRRAFFRNRGSRDEVIEAMSGQEIASRLLADTLWSERPALVAVR